MGSAQRGFHVRQGPFSECLPVPCDGLQVGLYLDGVFGGSGSGSLWGRSTAQRVCLVECFPPSVSPRGLQGEVVLKPEGALRLLGEARVKCMFWCGSQESARLKET